MVGYSLSNILVFNKNERHLSKDDLMALRCSQCSELLRDPYQLINCGHRVCRSCLHDVVLKKIPRVCPEDGEAVSENDMRVDKGCAKEIKSLKAVCAGYEHGCTWSGAIDEAEVHVEACPCIKVSCPQGCGQVLFKGELSSHLEECPKKPDTNQLVATLLQKVNNVEKEISDLKLQLKEVPFLRAKVSELYEELERIKNLPKANHKPHVNSFVSGYDSSSTYHSGYSSTGSGYSSSDDEDFRFTVKSLQKDVSMMKSQLAGYLDTSETVQESVRRHAIAMEEIKLRQDILDMKTTNGVFIWKIPEIRRRYSDAQQGRTISLYSPPFHTSPHGYRMCMRAYLNGDGSGKGTHISLFFVLMKSEHDNLLCWPFKCPVTFQLLNLSTSGNHITETFMPDPQSRSFHQPKSEMNIASGFPHFAKQSVFKNPNYTKDDTIFIRCKIDLTNIDNKLE